VLWTYFVDAALRSMGIGEQVQVKVLIFWREVLHDINIIVPELAMDIPVPGHRSPQFIYYN